MLYEKYEPVIGLEVHCQLDTETKAFSREPAEYGAPPNTQVAPVSLGHPGALPVLNRRVIEHALKLGLATHCSMAERAEFARKHYFYPDLPKGYQITQHQSPLCYDGYLDVTLEKSEGDGAPQGHTRRIGLTRIHVEEDAGRLLHDEASTRVDYNRCGVPLAEIVTEPDLRSPQEAAQLLRRIRQLVRYLGISGGDMSAGALRCDANVSVRRRGARSLNVKSEVKNLNSFRHVERALTYEVTRQIRQVERGETISAETRRWEVDTQKTKMQRQKEKESDYRYFAEPDLPPIPISRDLIERLRSELPEMPTERRLRYIKDMNLPAYDAGLLTGDRALADFFEATVSALASRQGGGNWQAQAKATSNVIMSAMMRALKERNLDAEELPISVNRMAALVDLRMQNTVSSRAAETIFDTMLDSDKSPEQIVEERNLKQVSDRAAIDPVVEAVLAHYSDKVQVYLNGKEGLKGFFIEQVKQRFEGAPNPEIVHRLLTKKLNARRS